MAPPQKKCPVPTCEYSTPAGLSTYDLVYRDIELHTQFAHAELRQLQHPSGHQSTASSVKADKLPRPNIGEGSTDSDWIYFSDQWERYKRSTGLQGQAAVDQLWACCSETLARTVYDSGGNNSSSETDLLAAIKKLAVRAQNKLVNVTNFLGMGQDRDETCGAFTARLKGQATVCDFSIKCSSTTCAKVNSYTDHMVAHQLVRGLSDIEIQEQVLGHAATNPDLDLNSITKFIEAKETGKRSTNLISSAAGLNRISDYISGRRRSNTMPNIPPVGESVTDLEGNCGWCGATGHGRRSPKEVRQKQCKAYKSSCNKCHKVGHYEKCCRSKATHETPNQNSITGTFCRMEITNTKRGQIKTLHHKVHDKYLGWVTRAPAPHPIVRVTVSLCMEGYEEMELPHPRVTNRQDVRGAMADTGAQMTVGDITLVHALGLTKRELLPLASNINAANRTALGLIGGILIKITMEDGDGKQSNSNQLCYISTDVQSLYLSREACADLGLIDEDFPTIKTQAGFNKLESDTPRPCSCPDRELPPPPPTSLPFPATEENTEKLKTWIVEKYAASAFNQCCHQTLPIMSGSPPLQLHINSKARPVAVHKAAPVPIHWQSQVKAELDRDVRLGVIEPVSIGEPVTWSSRMVVCPKKDGSPRRTVDLQSLNRASVRQTHATEAPFHQAASIPRNTLKTVVDCWNGYHAIPLAESDRHYTSFITPWGRYQYMRAPQGFLAAGDAYTARYDKVVAEVENMKKCVDDTCLWSDNLERSFISTCKYLSLCSNAGMVFNKKKFQFAQKEVEYLGFTITSTSVKPSSTYLQAIRDFPRPRDTTGIRSWFGLINQVNYALSQSDTMLPFRALLKPSPTFLWTQELQDSFEKSKDIITKAVEKGVETFDMSKVTCLATDWSKNGIGFSLLQKQCRCETLTTKCCKEGWSLVFAGSRFTSGAESRYAPVEGEALAVAWGLAKCKHFVLGCKTLVVAVDHLPLLKLLGDKNLEDIDNPRLENLKEKTLRYNFSLVHVPGRDHSTPDATSRHPTGQEEHMEIGGLTENGDVMLDDDPKLMLEAIRQEPTEIEVAEALLIEQTVMGSALSSLSSLSLEETSQDTYTVASLNSLQNKEAITWSRVEDASVRDQFTAKLVEMITQGLPEDKEDWPEDLRGLFWCRGNLSTLGPVVLYKDRIFIPHTLQSEVLEVLHSSHHGVTQMTARAMASVYWPGMQVDIEKRRAACASCDRSAPSQPAAPPTTATPPAYPFEQICSDYFTHGGRKYLIIVDRYSGWLSVYSVGLGDGCKVLINTLKMHFTTFGISAELASDGGSEYIADSTQQFLKDWGVQHRLSSSYFPHSNQRAELGVKSAKRLIRENVSADGGLDNDAFRRALLNHRNTPDRDTNLSPAQVLFGRPIRDFMPIKPFNYQPRPEWRINMDQRELALAKRHTKQVELLSEHTKKLHPLKLGDVVLVQNQRGRHPTKWDKSGLIVETLPHDQYKVKMDGSGRVTLRNRRFLKPITPYISNRSSPGSGRWPTETNSPSTSAPNWSVETPTTNQATDSQVEPEQDAQHNQEPGPPHAVHNVPEQEQQPDPIGPTQDTRADRGTPPRRSGRDRRQNTKFADYELYAVSSSLATKRTQGGGEDR